MGAATEENREICIEAGMNNRISKPTDLVYMLQKLMQYMRQPSSE